MAESLRDILEAAARGVFPAADGGVTVVPQHGQRDAGVIAFTAHSVVFTDEAEGWVRETLGALDCDPLAAAMHPRFLTALAARTGRAVDTVDVLLTGAPLPGGRNRRWRRSPMPGIRGWSRRAGGATGCGCGRWTAGCWCWAVGSPGGWRSRWRWRRGAPPGAGAAAGGGGAAAGRG